MAYSWHKVEELLFSELPDSKITEVTAGERRVCVIRKDNAIQAFAAKCPHAGAPLCDGWLDPQGRVVCPLHKYRFDPANGRNTTGEGYKLFIYPAEVRDNAIYVGTPNA